MTGLLRVADNARGDLRNSRRRDRSVTYGGVMALLGREARTDREIVMLRRRVDLLEQQLAVLVRFTGIDPGQLPTAREPLGERAQQLALRGHKVQAVKAHREDTHVDLATAVRDVDTFLARHESV